MWFAFFNAYDKGKADGLPLIYSVKITLPGRT